MQTLDPTLRLRIYSLDRRALRRQYIPPILRAAPMSLAFLLFMFAMLTGREADTWVVLLGMGAMLVLIAVIITLVLQKTMKKVLLTSLAIDDQSVSWMACEKVSSRIWRSDVEQVSFGTSVPGSQINPLSIQSIPSIQSIRGSRVDTVHGDILRID